MATAFLNPTVLGRAAKKGGVNIEALAAHPDGGLVVGFRSPLSDASGMTGNALLVHIQPVDGGWKVLGSAQLTLGDRGLRDLAADGDGWLAIAGPVDKRADFALFRIGADFSATEVGEASWLKDLRPEALVRDGNGWMLLSDDGKVKRADPDAEDGDRGCDKIRGAHGPGHPQVYARVRAIPNP